MSMKRLLLVLAACGTQDPLSSNLLAPPTFEVCVRTIPESARVLLDEQAARCIEVLEDDTIVVQVSAPGYRTSTQTVVVTGHMTLTVTLSASGR